MKRLILALLFAGAAFAQCGPNGTISYALGRQAVCVPKTGAAGYSAPFAAATGLTVTAATHGQGTKPVGFCYDNGTPALLIAQTATFPTVAANGDIVFAWTGSKTGYCLISALGGTGATGDTGATGATGATGPAGPAPSGTGPVQVISGTASAVTNANNAVLVSDGAGALSMATTLPDGLALGTPASATLTNATGLPEAGLSFTDITTNNASTSKHGLLPKLDGDSGHCLLGDGTYGPCGTGTGNVTVTGSPMSGDMTKFSGAASITNAVAGTDYAAAPAGTSALRADGAGGFAAAASTDLTDTADLIRATDTGTVTNAMLANSVTTINSIPCTIGSTCTLTGGTGDQAAYSASTCTTTVNLVPTSNVADTYKITLAGDCTSSFSSTPNTGERLSIQVCQPGVGGPYTFAWPTGFATAPTVSPVASACTSFTGIWNSTAIIQSVGADSGPLIFASEAAAPGTPPSGFVYCWPDSTDHAGLVCKANNSSQTYKMVKTGVDINTVTGQVTATHLASALPVSQGGIGVATITGVMVGNGTGAVTAVSGSGTDCVLVNGTSSACSGGGGGGSNVGFSPSVESVTASSTTSVTVTLNTTMTSSTQAWPVCMDSSRVGQLPDSWSVNSGLTTLTINFSPTAAFTGTCTAIVVSSQFIYVGDGASAPTPSTGNPLALFTTASVTGTCDSGGAANTFAICAWNGAAWVETAGAGGGGGSGTVNAGTATHFGYYATSTAAISDMGADFTFASHTITAGSSAILSLGAAPATTGLLIPKAAGAAPTADGQVAYDTTADTLVYGDSGNTRTVLRSGGALGTPASGTLTNATGLPISTGVSGLGTGVATMLATFSSANIASAATDETGTSLLVFNTSPLLVTPKATAIKDGNGNPFITSSATASAVDSITVTNAATADPATVDIAATGSDSNINLSLTPKGTGTVIIGGTTGVADFTEGTAPSGVASHDILYADSTAHRFKALNNNGSAVQMVVSGVDINTSDQVTVTHLAAALPVNQGGTGTTSTLTGLVRGSGSAMTAAELSGDATTSGSNAVTVVKVNGATMPASAPLVGTNSSNQIVLASPFATNAKTTTYQVLAADFSGYKTINVASGTFTITLVASGGTQPATGQSIRVVNYGSGVVTIARSGQNINGGTTSLTLPASSATAPSAAWIVSDGTDYFATFGEVPNSTGCTNQFVRTLNGTANPTCASVGTNDLSANAVTSAKLAVVNTYRICDIGVGDTSGSALTNGQLGPQKRICFIPYAATIVEVDVAADGGTPNVIVGKNTAGTQVNILSSALATAASGGIACSNTGGTTGLDGATTCSATLQNTSVSAGAYLELVSGTAGGTAKWMTAHVVYTVN